MAACGWICSGCTRAVTSPGVPTSRAPGAQDGQNLFANPSFEAGTEPWFFTWPTEQQNLRRTYRRASFLVTRLLANMGVSGETPLLSRFATPASGVARESVIRNGDFRLDAQRSGMPDHWQFTSDSKEAACVLEPPAAGCDPAVLANHLSRIRRQATAEASCWLSTTFPCKRASGIASRCGPKPPGLGRAGVTLALQNTATWQSLFDYQRFVPPETWKEFTFLVQANATAASQTRFQIWHGTAGTLWLSDVRMAPCDPPTEGRWTSGLYADQPQEWDDPYRFFRW